QPRSLGNRRGAVKDGGGQLALRECRSAVVKPVRNLALRDCLGALVNQPGRAWLTDTRGGAPVLVGS
ncbi:MAG TPA: hypothetical protein VGI20_08680, partial [Rhizomicrobium sp.]